MIEFKLEVFKIDYAFVYPLTAAIGFFGAHASFMWMLPKPRYFGTLWKNLLPRINFDRRDRTLFGTFFGLSFGIEI